jgi:hypothetical protein
MIFAQKANEHILERPVEEGHNEVVLGLARSPRTPTNLIKRCIEQQGVRSVKGRRRGK